VTYIEDLYYGLLDDGNDIYWQFDYDTSATTLDEDYYDEIYCGSSGTFYVEYYATFVTSGIGSRVAITVNVDLEVNSSMLDAQGYLYFFYEFTGSVSTSCYLKMYYLDFTEADYVLIGNSSIYVNEGGETIPRFIVKLDQLTFKGDNIENNIKSEYRYLSDSVVNHRMIIPSVRYASYIEIYTSEDYTFASISPTAMVGYSGTTKNYKILNPTELVYTICFYSERESYQALHDVSSRYLMDPGFDRSYNYID